MRKKRILSLLLSVIMVLSICASPLSSVFAATNTESELTGSELTTAANAVLNDGESSTNSGMDKLFDRTIKNYVDYPEDPGEDSADNPYAIAGEVVLGLLEFLLTEPVPDPFEDVRQQLTDMSSKMDVYHKEVMDTLEQISLQVGTITFETELRHIHGYNDTALKSLTLETNARTYLKGRTVKDILALSTDDNDRKQLTNYYKLIADRTVNVDAYVNQFKSLCESISANDAYGLALQKYKTKSTDANQVNKDYRKYIKSCTKDLILTYNCMIAGYKALENYSKLTGDEIAASDAAKQGKTLSKIMRSVLKKYLTYSKKDTTVLSVKVNGGEEARFHAFSKGWSVVTESLKAGNAVEATLYQDLVATNDYEKGFAPQAFGSATSKQNGYTAEGGLYINEKSSLTLNLNGYKIDGINRRMELIEVGAGSKLTVNGLPQDQLKDGQVQGLYNGRIGIKASAGDSGKIEINLNNVTMQNFLENGVRLSGLGGGEDSPFNYNTGSIEGAKQSAIYLEDRLKCNITNCVFKNNTSEKGGAIRMEELGGKMNVDVNDNSSVLSGCTFENNTATKDGGAIYSSHYYGWKMENCTFTKNTAGDSGGATYQLTYASGCTFTENTAKKVDGGAMCDVKNVDNCTFTGNSGKDGGAISSYYEQAAYPNFTNSTFTNNHATNDGGAIRIPAAQLYPTVDNCKFDSNTADHEGGAISSDSLEDVTVKNSNFNGNSSKNTGGAISTGNYCQAKIENSVFTGNSSKDWDGGALFLTGLKSEKHILTNVTITGNTAKHWGGGIYCQRQTGATGDFIARGKVVVSSNTAEKGSNVLLEQKNGTNKCVIVDETSDGASIGLNTDYDASRSVVWDVKDESRFFGDEGRKLSRDGSSLVTNELGGGGCNK